MSTLHSSLAWPAPAEIGSAHSQNYEFSELCFRFRATPFTSPHSLINHVAFATQPYTTGRLTKPYPGRSMILADHFLLNWQPLPGYPQLLIFSVSHLLPSTIYLLSFHPSAFRLPTSSLTLSPFRVGRSLPRLQENVCFLCYPPAFAAVPQDLFHTLVALLPLTEPDKRLSHIRLFSSPFSMPPPYDMGPGLCGLSVSATLPRPMPG